MRRGGRKQSRKTAHLCGHLPERQAAQRRMRDMSSFFAQRASVFNYKWHSEKEARPVSKMYQCRMKKWCINRDIRKARERPQTLQDLACVFYFAVVFTWMLLLCYSPPSIKLLATLALTHRVPPLRYKHRAIQNLVNEVSWSPIRSEKREERREEWKGGRVSRGNCVAGERRRLMKQSLLSRGTWR